MLVEIIHAARMNSCGHTATVPHYCKVALVPRRSSHKHSNNISAKVLVM